MYIYIYIYICVLRAPTQGAERSSPRAPVRGAWKRRCRRHGSWRASQDAAMYSKTVIYYNVLQQQVRL